MKAERIRRASYTVEQIGSGAIGSGWSIMRGDSRSSGNAQSDIRELGSASGKRPIVGYRSQAGECGTNGIDATEGRACKSEDGARHSKKSDGVLCAGINMKYAWIEQHKSCWPVSRQCEVLNVSVSGYFGHQRRRIADDLVISGKRFSNAALLVHIKAVHAESQRRIWLAKGLAGTSGK